MGEERLESPRNVGISRTLDSWMRWNKFLEFSIFNRAVSWWTRSHGRTPSQTKCSADARSIYRCTDWGICEYNINRNLEHPEIHSTVIE